MQPDAEPHLPAGRLGPPAGTRGIITWRPVTGDRTEVQLVIQRLRSGSPPVAARDLHRIFVQQARIAQSALAGSPAPPPQPEAAPAAGGGQGSR